LEALDMDVVQESVRKEFILNNYAVNYEKHMKQLIELFMKYSLPVARQFDERARKRRTCLDILHSFYAPSSSSKKLHKEDLRKRKVKNADNDESQEQNDAKFSENDNETAILARLQTQIAFAYLPLSDKASRGEEPAQETEVYVSVVNSPARFYVQSTYSYDLLERLNDGIADQVRKAKDMENNDELDSYKKQIEFIRGNLNMETYEWIKSKSVPLYCLARLKNDGFFRAEITNCQRVSCSDESGKDELKWSVFFVDYGDQDVVTLADIYPLTEAQMPFRSLPFQAIECSLEQSIRPLKCGEMAGVWSEEVGDHLWSLTHTTENYLLKLYAQALSVMKNSMPSSSSSSSSQMSRRSYMVNLKRKAYPEKLSIAHQLAGVVYRLNDGLIVKRCAELTREEKKSFHLSSQSVQTLFAEEKSSVLYNYTKQFLLTMIK
jgi:hypothetical protein